MCLKYIKYFDGKNNFVFIGDTRIRQVYYAFIKKLDKDLEAMNIRSDLVETSIQQYLYNGTHNQTYDFSVNYADKALNLEIVSGVL